MVWPAVGVMGTVRQLNFFLVIRNVSVTVCLRVRCFTRAKFDVLSNGVLVLPVSPIL